MSSTSDGSRLAARLDLRDKLARHVKRFARAKIARVMPGRAILDLDQDPRLFDPALRAPAFAAFTDWVEANLATARAVARESTCPNCGSKDHRLAPTPTRVDRDIPSFFDIAGLVERLRAIPALASLDDQAAIDAACLVSIWGAGHVGPIRLQAAICADCGLAYTRAPMSGAAAEYYATVIKRTTSGLYGRAQEAVHAKTKAEVVYNAVTALGGVGALAGRALIDVGCAEGVALFMFRALGARPVVGVEPHQAEARYARDILELPEIIAAPMSADLFGDRRFDIAFSHHVIEHTGTPDAFLSAIRAVLAPGGRLFLQCPLSDPLDPILENTHAIGFDLGFARRSLAKAGLEVETEILDGQGLPFPSPGLTVLARRPPD